MWVRVRVRVCVNLNFHANSVVKIWPAANVFLTAYVRFDNENKNQTNNFNAKTKNQNNF